jgi:hypothetical protein
MDDYNLIEYTIRNLTRNISHYNLADNYQRLFGNGYSGKLNFLLFNATYPLKIIKNVPYKNNFCKISSCKVAPVLCYCCKEYTIEEIDLFRVRDIEKQNSYFFHPKCIFDLSLYIDKIILKIGRKDFNRKIYNILLFMNNDLISDIFIEIGKFFINTL